MRGGARSAGSQALWSSADGPRRPQHPTLSRNDCVRACVWRSLRRPLLKVGAIVAVTENFTRQVNLRVWNKDRASKCARIRPLSSCTVKRILSQQSFLFARAGDPRCEGERTLLTPPSTRRRQVRNVGGAVSPGGVRHLVKRELNGVWHALFRRNVLLRWCSWGFSREVYELSCPHRVADIKSGCHNPSRGKELRPPCECPALCLRRNARGSVVSSWAEKIA